jgi:glycosyltransferase involved in cell wall biosynthesis
MTRPTILLSLAVFRPSLRANGASITLVHNAAALGDRFHFRIVSQADPGEEIGRWHQMDGLDRIALAPGRPFDRGLGKLLEETPSDLLLCNSFFDPAETIPILLKHRAGRLAGPVMVAPHGELAASALSNRPLKKNAWLHLVRTAGLLKGVSLQATSDDEAAAIRQRLPYAGDILVGPNLREIPPLPPNQRDLDDRLRLCFVSRIDPIKNLAWAIDLAAQSGVPCLLDIYGPVSSPDYWQECRQRIAASPPTIECRVMGTLEPSRVIRTVANYDLFILPTRGENFGHAIAESLLAGTPVLIADTTPWRGLEAAKAGADLPLDDREQWLRFLRTFAALDPAQRLEWRHGARRCAEQRLDPVADAERLAACFEAAMGR